MRTSSLLLLVLAGLLFQGCSKSSGRRSDSPAEEKITGNPSEPPVALQPQWNPSNRYSFRMSTRVNSEFPRRDQPTPVRQETTFGLDYSVAVTNVLPDGGRRLELEIRSVQWETVTDDKIVFYFDSENKVMGSDGSAMAEGLEKMVGARLGIRLSQEERVASIDGLRELTDSAGGGDSRGRGQGSLRRMLTPQFFKQLVELESWPANPVRIGESWTARREVSAGFMGSLTAELTYILKGWQKREAKHCALLECKGEIKAQARPEKGQRGPPASIEGGIITGKTWFDPEWRFPLETVFDQALTITGTNRGGRGTNSEPRTFSTTLREHTTIKLLDVRPLAE